uniref:Uncharacterized protein n=1 Tax=mine drainage metagenome TaxID=410659 RepID=E6QJ21_9ZZZZ
MFALGIGGSSLKRKRACDALVKELFAGLDRVSRHGYFSIGSIVADWVVIGRNLTADSRWE